MRCQNYINSATCNVNTANVNLKILLPVCVLYVICSSISKFSLPVVVGESAAATTRIIQQQQQQQKYSNNINNYININNDNDNRYISAFVIQKQQQQSISKFITKSNNNNNHKYKHKIISSLQQQQQQQLRYQTQITTTSTATTTNNKHNNKLSSFHLFNRIVLVKQKKQRIYNKDIITLFSASSSSDLVSEMSESSIKLNTANNNNNNRIVSPQINNNSINIKNKGITTTIQQKNERQQKQLLTVVRVVVPSIICGIIAGIVFPSLSMLLVSSLINNSQSTLTVLSQDTSQFVQNFLSVASLLFSILVGQTYYFLYTQQESLYYALFEEVTEAKSLLEQVALVCQGRSMYPKCLLAIQNYVTNDLKQIQKDPALLLSSRPIDDPLESIMYMTSVGVPSTIYMTIKSLRETRARRLGALQRKLPRIHILLLYILACIELISFPLLGAGTQIIGGTKLLSIEGILFGIITFGIVLTLRVVSELWRPAGGSYNVDTVLSIMISGLEDELHARMNGQTIFRTSSSSQNLSPSSATSDKTKAMQYKPK